MIDINAISERYHRALDAKPGKGPISEAGIAAITDSVCDVPTLLDAVNRLKLADTYQPEGVEIVVRQIHDYRQHVVELQDLLAEQRRLTEAAEAEVGRVREAAHTLGKIIDDQCRDVLDITGAHDLIGADGDGDWAAVWDRLREMAGREA